MTAKKKEEGHKEDGVFVPIFASIPQRLIETMILHPDFDYEAEELAEITCTTDSELHLHLNAFLRYEIIEITQVNPRRFKFNADSPVGTLLNQLAFKLADLDLPALF